MFPLPPGCAPDQIAPGDGALWVTCSNPPFVYEVSTQGVPTQIKVPSGSTDNGGIIQAPNGAIWFTEPGNNRLARITM